jgi:hypothetical protein
MQEDVRKWLSPPDAWKNQNIARKSQHSGTAEWFVQGDTFSAWKASDPSSLLWIHGKRSLLPGLLLFLETDDFFL